MELEVIEGKCAIPPVEAADIQPSGSSTEGVMIGCCIIHFWCWEPGTGLCC